MKKFLNWFRNNTKIKRWMFLILIGIVLTCFGFSKILTSEKLEIKDLMLIIGTFVAGFTCFVVGIVYIQKRNLELLIETNKLDSNKKELKQLVSDNIYKKGPNIVVIGGGNGISNILKGLKNYTNNLTAIVPVSSYGISSTVSVKELKLNPVKDIKDSIISLSPNSKHMKDLINYTFQEGKLKGFTFGDIYLYVMQQIYGDFTGSIEKINNILSMVGKILPVTLDEMKICAELQDGTVIEDKSKIADIVSNKITKINRVYINPSNCRTAPGVLEAIENADAIIIGPGSLYTNVIPNLLIKNVAKTIRESKALKIYISNIMTEPGQTDDYDVSDHIQSILEHSGDGIIDFCISDVGEIVPEYVRKYNLRGSDIVNADSSKIRSKGIKLIKGELATIEDNYIIHDSDKTAKLIIELICTDLRFKDQHNNEQYMLLNTKLKEENKRAKKTLQKGKGLKDKIKKQETKKGSKFSNKYRDRIESIKESEKTRIENIKIHEKAKQLIEEEEKKEKAKFLKETYNKRKK
ncbi:MAG: YvcK family protein [Clostridia bacterium]|nr:YvcK family protein [Clostridia bacterium]